MTDIVEQIDALAADEKCPNCGRQWHEQPLSWAVAHMHDHGHIDHLTGARKSPIVCDGSALIGPRRPPYEPSPSRERRELSFAGLWTLPPNPLVQFVDQVSGYSYVEQFASPSPSPIAAFYKAMQSMTDAFAALLGLDLSIDVGSWMLPELLTTPEPIDCTDIPALDIEFGPQHWTAEHPPAPTALTVAVKQRWYLLTATTTHAPDPPGYDFTAFQDAVDTKQYPTTKKRRKK